MQTLSSTVMSFDGWTAEGMRVARFRSGRRGVLGRLTAWAVNRLPGASTDLLPWL
ncbi:hypothetical protein GCM10009637_14890 [Brevibacterium luteolum]